MDVEPRVGNGLKGPRVVTPPARPEPIRVDADQTAIMAIDMGRKRSARASSR